MNRIQERKMKKQFPGLRGSLLTVLGSLRRDLSISPQVSKQRLTLDSYGLEHKRGWRPR